MQTKAKLESLRQRLHNEYYQNLVNPPKPKELPTAKKIEQEEKLRAQVRKDSGIDSIENSITNKYDN